jgi:hypothetical protein
MQELNKALQELNAVLDRILADQQKIVRNFEQFFCS